MNDEAGNDKKNPPPRQVAFPAFGLLATMAGLGIGAGMGVGGDPFRPPHGSMRGWVPGPTSQPRPTPAQEQATIDAAEVKRTRKRLAWVLRCKVQS